MYYECIIAQSLPPLGYKIFQPQIAFSFQYQKMITNKLVKQAKKSDVIVEFSTKEELPEVIAEFLKICKAESIPYKRIAIASYQISYYYVNIKKNTLLEDFKIENVPTELEHAMTVIYMTRQNQSKIDLPEKPGVRTLLLREDLQPKYSLQYETQSVETKRSAVNFLCDMCAAFLNRACCKEVQFYDQKVQQVIKVRKGEANVLKDTWVNILYQIPGLGKEKCLRIAENFPTYQSILKDYEEKQKLKDLMIGKSKLGTLLATRIYKVFLGTKYKSSVVD